MRENDRYIIVPCELFKGFASSPEKRRECINNVINYALFIAYRECGSMDGAYDYLHVNVDKDEKKEEIQERSIAHGKEIANGIKGKCKFYLSVDELFEFRDQVKPYNQCIQFLGYHALKSIQGNASYFKSSNGLLLARMDGQDKPSYQFNTHIDEHGKEVSVALVECLEVECPVLQKFATKYKMAQLREALHKYRGVSFYIPKNKSGNGNTYTMRGGFFFSTKLNMEELILAVELCSGAKLAKKDGGLKSETEYLLEKLRKEGKIK